MAIFNHNNGGTRKYRSQKMRFSDDKIIDTLILENANEKIYIIGSIVIYNTNIPDLDLL